MRCARVPGHSSTRWSPQQWWTPSSPQGDSFVRKKALVDRKQRPDAVLAADAAAGDAAAFAELYERHAGSVYGYCRRVLRSKDQAADATHEAFVSVLERLRNLQRQPIVAPRPYLFKAAHNACVRIATGQRHTDDVDTPPEPKHHGDLSETERIVLTRELQDDVRAANEQLSLRHREVLALRDVEQLRYDQIARIMDITPNAAAQLAWRGRARLRPPPRRPAVGAVGLQTLDGERALGLLELAEVRARCRPRRTRGWPSTSSRARAARATARCSPTSARRTGPGFLR